MAKLAGNAVAAINLNDLVINTPCPMDWDRMDGDDRKRFCSRCEKHVYNVAEMTEHEALQLIGNGDRAVCARIFRRPDGTIVTNECPVVGKKATGRWFQFSIATLVTLLTSSAALFASAPWIGRQIEPIVERWFPRQQPTPFAAPFTRQVVGDLMLPIPPANTAVMPSPATPTQCDSPT